MNRPETQPEESAKTDESTAGPRYATIATLLIIVVTVMIVWPFIFPENPGDRPVDVGPVKSD